MRFKRSVDYAAAVPSPLPASSLDACAGKAEPFLWRPALLCGFNEVGVHHHARLDVSDYAVTADDAEENGPLFAS